MSNEPLTFTRNQNLLCGRDIDKAPLIKQMYDDLQEDYRAMVCRILDWSLLSYTVPGESDRDQVTVVTSEDIRSRLAEQHDEETLGWILEVGESFTNKSAADTYMMFYANYKAKGPKWNKKRAKFFESLPTMSEEDFDKEIASKDFRAVNREKWGEVRDALRQNADAASVKAQWESVKWEMDGRLKYTAERLRGRLNLTCKHPKNSGYCRALTRCLKSTILSQSEKLKQHVEELAELGASSLAAMTRADKLGDLLNDLWKGMDAYGSGISWRTLRWAIADHKKGKDASSELCRLIRRDQFKPLFEEEDEKIRSVYDAVRSRRRYERRASRRPFPCRPLLKGDVKFPFGLTGLPTFKVTNVDNEGHVEVKFCTGETVRMHRSHYFSDLKVEQAKDKDSKKLKFFHVSYRKKLKVRGKNRNNVPTQYNDWVKSELREITLSRRNGGWYVGLPHAIAKSPVVEKIQNFLRGAEVKPKYVAAMESMPDSFRSAAYDLNLGNPLVGGIVESNRGDQGSIKTLDYGSGDFVVKPQVICADTKLSRRIQVTGKKCGKLVWVMRHYKFVLREAYERNARLTQLLKDQIVRTLTEDEAEEKRKLKQEVKREVKLKHLDKKAAAFIQNRRLADGKRDNPRLLIERRVSKLTKTISDYHDIVRRSGYKHLSECIRLLEADESCNSMTSSYNRIGLDPGQSKPTERRLKTWRSEFRTYVARKYASEMVRFAQQHNASVIIAENLKTRLDSDSDKNSISRLFSPASILGALESAAMNAGLGLVLAAANGTSKIDHLTGKVGYRNFKRKGVLVVDRDNTLYEIECDENAVYNIAIRGLNHSIVPYRIVVPLNAAHDGEGGDQEDEVAGKQKKAGVRISRFFKVLFGTEKPLIFVNGTSCAARSKDQPKPNGYTKMNKGVLYAHGLKLHTEEKHRADERAIKERVEKKENVIKLHEHVDFTRGFQAFSMTG